jgi:phospholipid/cholesterol/gamma-HCH transport system substrate-binding protein
MRLTKHVQQAIVGLIGLSLFAAATTIGVQWSFGYYDDTYRLTGTFDAAGQGLQSGSDVKLRGVNIGHVAGVELVRGRALVKMDIEAGERVPASSKAVVRPKTLFGEKFVDVVPDGGEAHGPFLHAGDEFAETLGGFELERVLADAYPILKAIDPAELATVVSNLAEGGRGLGPDINRTIVAFRAIADVWARHDGDTRLFLDDVAKLTGELETRADDLVAGAGDLNEALPVITDHADDLTTVLDQAARLSGDLADVLDHNRGFLTKSATMGADAMNALYERRARIGPLITGLRQYVQTIAEATGIPLDDGTVMARVRAILGGDPCGRQDPGTCVGSGSTSTVEPPAGDLLEPLGQLPIPQPQEGVDAVTELLGQVLR